ncbi:MAG: putative rane protein [candidate division NC10 bacterium]|jgi:hypothetical protein|nr:putative rane protein [candidate division NC10 bacterium]
MTDHPPHLSRRTLKSPSAAAIAGILFALLYGASLVLVRISIPAGASADTTSLDANLETISLALNLVPYAGIAFLWFIGVIRDRLGDQEDRLFATVFLGSGLLFLALTLVGVAMAGGVLASYATEKSTLLVSGVYAYSRAVMYNLINIYAIRMAGVCMISLGTIWLRTGLMHRGWAFVTYALALVLLLSLSLSAWVPLIFPGWVFAVSVYFLIRMRKDRHEETSAAT